MAKRPRAADDYDSPWKDALQNYLQQFLAFFFADIGSDIDWLRGYVALDKEFQQIVRHAEVGKRLADKLFKVWLRGGEEVWLLIHVEIQGAYEKAFPQRMFDYNTAIRRLYNRDVVSLAVLCDDDPTWRPTSFSYGRWKCRTEVIFRCAKLWDFRQKMASLEKSPNPFATVVLAHLQALDTASDPVSRRQLKLALAKGLYRKNWTSKDVRQLFLIIDWIMTLPQELEEEFRSDIHTFEKENSVRYVSSIERYGFKRGLEKGLEKGLEQGRKALLESIEIILDNKFGSIGRKLQKDARALKDLEELRQFARFLKTAENVDDARAYLESKRASE